MGILMDDFQSSFFPLRLPTVSDPPEDWPPEGSASFVCSALMDAPLDEYVKCEFSLDWDENDSRNALITILLR